MTKKIVIASIALVIGLVIGFSMESNQSVGSLSEKLTKTDYLEALDAVITRSPDGFVLYGSFTVGTTTPVRVALTNGSNEGENLICDGSSLFIYSDATADFAPSFKVAVGTSTSATGYSANLLASTTIATSTDTVTSGVSWPFILAKGSSITLSVGDYTAAIASSTYYGNWSGQIGIHCWEMGK